MTLQVEIIKLMRDLIYSRDVGLLLETSGAAFCRLEESLQVKGTYAVWLVSLGRTIGSISVL